MISLTLEYDGTEKFLADWGYSEPHLSIVTTMDGPSIFTVTVPGSDPAGADDIPNWGAVIIRMGRAFAEGAFSGGSIIFAGKRTDLNRIAQPQNPGTTRVFSDPWYDLTQTTFQHYWKYWNGSAFEDFYFSRLNMFQDISAGPGVPWTYLTTYGQILQIITYAASAGANLQAGTIDPTWTVPSYGVKAITCAEALGICVKPMADVIKYFDYTTTPPKLHIRQRGELGSQTLPYAGVSGDGHRSHVSSQLKSRDDLQPPCVSVQYMTNNTVDEKNYTSFTTDTFPAMVDPKQMGALIIPIDLRGSVRVNVHGVATTVACLPAGIAFWQRHKKDLADSLVTGLAIVNTAINDGSDQCITIKDKDGTNVSLTDYPNEHNFQGDIATWMTADDAIVANQVTITGWLTYSVKHPKATSQVLHQIPHHQVSVNVKLTNSAVGTQKYSALKSYTAGDPEIIGLAENIYDSLAQLQWEGDHTILDPELTGGIVSPALNLNLAGGATEWETMAAAIARVTVDFTRGMQEISFGPHKHLTADQFVEYLLLWRARQVYDNPSVRSDGQTNSANDVQMPEHQPVKDTTHGVPIHTQMTITAVQDPVAGVATDAQINLDASLLANYTPPGGGPGLIGLMDTIPDTQRIIKPRNVQVCVNGNVMQMTLLAGPPMPS